MPRLLVDADDFGMSPGVNKGIIKAIQHGIVRNTGVMVNYEHANDARFLLREYPYVSLGIHFCIEDQQMIWGPIQKIEQELDAQVQRFISLVGSPPTYFNGHRNILRYPRVLLAALRVAKRWRIPFTRSFNLYLPADRLTRFNYYVHHPQRAIKHLMGKLVTQYMHLYGVRTADRQIFLDPANYSKKSSLETWLHIIEILPEGINEIYCHPGYPDESLAQYATYVREREIEVEVLTCPELRQAIKDKGIQLISFKDLL
ncbi:MAG TPA: ChbG/HpnK family deacetylase [Desulfobacterales bacterium]|nr:ChbG/HpnK family deacetylase [Desulfobacterales bacterium]